MILSLFIILILIFSFFTGYQSGFILELFHLISYVFAWIISLILINPIDWLIDDWFLRGTSSKLFIHGLIFFLIFLIIHYFIIKMGMFFNVLSHFPVIHKLNQIGGGIISFLICYFIIFLVLTIGLQTNITTFQNQYYNSSIAELIVNQTPMISHHVFNNL
ncbi:hypothetical protein WR164_06660 [Philodulcilactobacillus myokoensis]|uniref:CvpA family protein n=1 Tax=Philodulcilactobacillus myokoensis TaxID=2929573 RepID=A0A9W6ESP5_9LACO|nr:CvpA family protein [Philodulcilactobacillus myokoensis]GLB46687.1 hypothetical protein WR164_06660 [Philodulcilactobacillus myokoensis]